MINQVNPYYGLTFFDVIIQFFFRIFSLLTGRLSLHQLASDEVQIFVLMGVALSSALVGTFLVLRRMTMLANALSHTILMGIVLAFFLSSSHGDSDGVAPMETLLFASLITAFFTTFLTEFLVRCGNVQEEASTGLVFTSLFAVGIILVTVLTRSAHIGIEAVMGNADALHISDIQWVVMVAIANLFIILLFFKEYQLTTFDKGLALALGFSPVLFNYLLMAQVAVTTMASFRAVGVLLVLAFMTGPPLAAKLCVHHLGKVLLVASLLGMGASLVGVALTRHVLTTFGVSLSTAGVVVCIIALVYFTTLLTVKECKKSI